MSTLCQPTLFFFFFFHLLCFILPPLLCGSVSKKAKVTPLINSELCADYEGITAARPSNCYLFELNSTFSFILQPQNKLLKLSNVLNSSDPDSGEVCYRMGVVRTLSRLNGLSFIQSEGVSRKMGYISRKLSRQDCEHQTESSVVEDEEEVLDGYIFLGSSETYKIQSPSPSSSHFPAGRTLQVETQPQKKNLQRLEEQKRGTKELQYSWMNLELRAGLSFPEFVFDPLLNLNLNPSESPGRFKRESIAGGLHVGLMIVTDDTMTEYYEEEDLVIYLLALIGDIQSVYRYR